MNSGAWIWRGKLKSQWQSLGFDRQVFETCVKMRGAGTRLGLMEALSRPADRLQLAQELDIDWKSVDRHIGLLNRLDLVHEDQAVGRVRMYRRTTAGDSLLRLLKQSGAQGQRDPLQSHSIDV